jgi:hypothetical protein
LNRKHDLRPAAGLPRYLARAPRDFITFEYCMLDGVNDGPSSGARLVDLVQGRGPRRAGPAHSLQVQPDSVQPVPASGLKRSPRERVLAFARVLQDAGIVATIRKTRGDDIDAACGQLAGEVTDRTNAVQSACTPARARDSRSTPAPPEAAMMRPLPGASALAVAAVAVLWPGPAGRGVTQPTSRRRARDPHRFRPDRPERRARVRLELATAYFSRGQRTRRSTRVKLALQAKPDMPEAFNLRGLIYASHGRTETGRESFQRALQLARVTATPCTTTAGSCASSGATPTPTPSSQPRWRKPSTATRRAPAGPRRVPGACRPWGRPSAAGALVRAGSGQPGAGLQPGRGAVPPR